MAGKKGLIDIWIVDSNTVYREVPFTVVTDWIQQGRLLPEDKARPAGTERWHLLAKVSAFQIYFPKPEPQRAEDPAEALEPVEPEFAWKSSMELEDDDVDMIPLIDVSLVLLIFFMMTAAVSSGVLSPIKTPPAEFELATIGKDMYWLGVDVAKDGNGKVEKGADGWPLPVYSLGKGDGTFDLPKKNVRDPSIVMAMLEQKVKNHKGEVRVRIRADETHNIGVIREMTVELQKLQTRINAARKKDKIALKVSGEVSEPVD